MADQVLREAGEFDLEGAYRMDETWRIGKASAQLEHLERALAYERSKLRALTDFYDHMAEELDRLRPHWLPGMTKAQAIAAYLASPPRPAEQEDSAEPQPALTVAGLLAALDKACAKAGPQAVVRMVDEEAVVSVSVLHGVVYISDLRQSPGRELADLD
jgi:hypothetical protein